MEVTRSRDGCALESFGILDGEWGGDGSRRERRWTAPAGEGPHSNRSSSPPPTVNSLTLLATEARPVMDAAKLACRGTRTRGRTSSPCSQGARSCTTAHTPPAPRPRPVPTPPRTQTRIHERPSAATHSEVPLGCAPAWCRRPRRRSTTSGRLASRRRDEARARREIDSRALRGFGGGHNAPRQERGGVHHRLQQRRAAEARRSSVPRASMGATTLRRRGGCTTRRPKNTNTCTR